MQDDARQVHQLSLLTIVEAGTAEAQDEKHKLSLREQFVAFHRENPQVYTALRELALDLNDQGHGKWSINGLFEVLRWRHAMMVSDPHSDFKLNNNYRAFYARLLMAQEPVLDGFFELRRQTSQRPPSGLRRKAA